ncbi:MAG: DNA helicase [Actinobacteria bacterium HGW-Actinobacteria-4]|nr:MAG: DNA helicase [Actinobacteria bacterium HGW-Actinobacteria-4]
MSEVGLVLGKRRNAVELTHAINPEINPTAEQVAIISAGLDPMLVVAGAGSGKTETLSMRMVYLLDHGERLFGRHVSPDEILCLTFTRKAAAEIADRAAKQMSRVFGEDPERAAPAVATYNGYAAALVAEHGLRLAVDPESTMLTDAALWQMANALVEDWTGDIDADAAVSSIVRALPRLSAQLGDHQRSVSDLRVWARDAIDFLEALPKKDGDAVPGKMTQAMAKDIGKFRSLLALTDVVEAFQARKRDGSFLDFSDQVEIAARLSQLEAVQSIERSRYRVVLLDEFQDTSPGQLQLFANMFGADHPVMAVGDPNQAIYGFRGASAAALPAFVDQFGGDARVTQATLSVSWRNEASVLGVANAAAAPLREGANVHVAPLRSRGEERGVPEPQRASPGVVAHIFNDLVDEADGIASFIADHRIALSAGRPRSRVPMEPPSAAVLCRRRAQFTAVVDALDRAGLDYEVVGLGGLLDTPEVADLVALLEVAHDPSRGDSLMRLLTSERVALGPRDLAALADWSRELAGPRAGRESEPSIVDAIAALPARDWESAEGRELTDTARERLERLHHAVDSIRTHTYLPLTELVLFAERAWGLDIEAAVARPDGRAARNIDAFVDAARTFARGADHATLGALISWLDAARDEESGLDAPIKEPEPGAVQVLTVHAAKGLEWDIVAVPGMNDGQFPKVTVPTASSPTYRDSAWLDGIGDLPWELRMDREDLPHWYWREATDHRTFAASLAQFKEDAGQHKLDEERRLFYVAITRARSHVLLSGAWWSMGKTVKVPSSFITELVDSGHVSSADWSPTPAADDEPPSVYAPSAMWPPEPTVAQRQRRELAHDVLEVLGATAAAEAPDHTLPLAREVTAMLAERQSRSAGLADVVTPAHLSTSALVAMRRDRDAFTAQLRRPLPTQPAPAAQRGSALHAWIETQYGHQPLWDDVDIGPGEDDAADLEALKAVFEKSEWKSRVPSSIEVDVEVPVAGVTVRSRIDAVFPPGHGLDRVTVVDWKSGRPPTEPHEREAREVQLAVYRLAWAEWKGLPVGDVDAAFYYVAADTTVRPERLLSRDEIVALIRGDE